MFVTRDTRASTSDSVESTESLVGDRKKICVCPLRSCPKRSCACECADGFLVFYISSTVLTVIGVCLLCFKMAGLF
jgi:hypothetical protein